jgi:hypothetical protein
MIINYIQKAIASLHRRGSLKRVTYFKEEHIPHVELSFFDGNLLVFMAYDGRDVERTVHFIPLGEIPSSDMGEPEKVHGTVLSIFPKFPQTSNISLTYYRQGRECGLSYERNERGK